MTYSSSQLLCQDEDGALGPNSILTKAFQVLRAFESADKVMSLSQIARASGLPKSTVHRLIARLLEVDALEHHRGNYRIGLGLLQTASRTPVQGLRDLAMPYLAALHRWSGLTVHFGVLRGMDVFYLEKLAPGDSPCKVSSVGLRLPANCSAIGRALLAWENSDLIDDILSSGTLPRMTDRSTTSPAALLSELAEVKAAGLAHEEGQMQLDVACIGAPIVVYGHAVAAASISYPIAEAPNFRMENALREAAARIAVDCRQRVHGNRSYLFPRDI